MALTLFDFVWPVPAKGFRWNRSPSWGWNDAKVIARVRARDEREGRPFRAQISASAMEAEVERRCRLVPRSSELVKRNPLSHDGLLFELASIQGDRSDDILWFANEFGDILHADGQGSRLGQWRRSVLALSSTLSLMKARGSRLAGYVEQANCSKGFSPNTIADISEKLRNTPELVEFAGRRSATLPLQRQGEHLVHLAIYAHSLAYGGLEFSVVHAAEGKRLSLQPRTLLGAIWLQLAQCIATAETFLRCAECSKPFGVGRSARATREFCSTKCRVRSHRRRKREQQG